MKHEHREFSHLDGQFRCVCGAVRLSVGHWADVRESRRLVAAARRETARLMAHHGTAVDAYGQRLAACPVCGDGVPLTGPSEGTAWQTCRDCLGDGWTGATGDDILRAVGGEEVTL